MATGPWRRRTVHDLVFAIDGSGWHEPEMRDAVGFRWSGPGRFSVLRVQAPPGPGRALAQIVLMPGETIPEVAVFLNGHRLAIASRRLGEFGMVECAWDGAATAGGTRHEFWFLAERMLQLPAPGQTMRSVGFRLSTLTVEGMEHGPAAEGETIALIAGSRVLAERLPVTAGRAWISFRSQGAARLLDLRLEAARLGPTPQPHLAFAIQAGPEGIELALGAPGGGTVTAEVPARGGLRIGPGLAPRDVLLVLRLLGELPDAFGRWLDRAMAGAAPDAELLSYWRRHLGILAREAQATLAGRIADGPDPFAGDPAVPFAWPAVSS